MPKFTKYLPVLVALMIGAPAAGMAQTSAETHAPHESAPSAATRADQVTAIIKSLAPISGTTVTPPVGVTTPTVVHPLPDVFLPPVVISRPQTIIIDRRPIVLDYRYSVDMTVYFAYDSAFLTPQARQYLDMLGLALQAPELSGNRYLIAGHTDARGPHDYNIDLAYRRAWAVKRYLMRYYSIPSWRLEVVGWGESYPRNSLDPYSAINRRVEITLIGTGLTPTVQPLVPQAQPQAQSTPQDNTGEGTDTATAPLLEPQQPEPMPPVTTTRYVPALPPCPAGVVGPDGQALDLDDFSPEPWIDCDPGLTARGRVIVQPDGRMIVLP